MIKKIILFIIMINSVFLTGCWNYKDIDQIRMVGCMAVDYDKEKDEYITTIEIINPASKEEQQMSGELYTSIGKLPFEGVRDIIMKAGRKLYWGHTKVMIVSKDIAKNKMIPILDYAYRDAEFRSDVYIIVSKEKTAKEILEKRIKYKVDAVMGYHLYDVLKSQKHIEKYHRVELWRYLKCLYMDGMSPVLPAIENRVKDEKNESIISGIAVFDREKMVGWLDEHETKAFLWIIDQINASIIVFPAKLENESVKVTLEILNNKTKIKPIIVNDNILMEINIKTNMRLEEIAGTEDFISKKGREVLKKDAQKYIQNEIEKLIKKVQNKYHSDIFGFSRKIKKEMPDTWRKIKPNWKEVFTNLDIKVNVDVNIEGSALQQKPIKIGM